MHILQGLVESLPTEACPQGRVPFHNTLPGMLEGRNVTVLKQGTAHLLDLHRGPLGIYTMEEHAVLYRGKLIRILNALYGHCPPNAGVYPALDQCDVILERTGSAQFYLPVVF